MSAYPRNAVYTYSVCVHVGGRQLLDPQAEIMLGQKDVVGLKVNLNVTVTSHDAAAVPRQCECRLLNNDTYFSKAIQVLLLIIEGARLLATLRLSSSETHPPGRL